MPKDSEKAEEEPEQKKSKRKDHVDYVDLFREKLIQFAMQMLFDEYEIISWINFIDRFQFFDFCYDVNDLDSVMNSTFINIMLIGGATKCITNHD